ncbi:MAG: hypothetical protein NDI61_03210 [Bdellovibrionaceae bacterium]|nr:hypothetical protein [Pseudobdellovibrionaceae bacterium]
MMTCIRLGLMAALLTLATFSAHAQAKEPDDTNDSTSVEMSDADTDAHADSTGAATGDAEPNEGTDETQPVPAASATTVPDKIRFAAIVQYATKGAERVDARKVRMPLNFQDALYEGDRVRVDKNAYVKLVLKNGCVFVIYGDGQALAPNREKPWRISSDAMRAICPESSEMQPISFRNQRLDPAGTDILITGNRLLVLRGSPKAKGLEKVNAPQVFSASRGGWKPVSPAPSQQDIYQLNQSRPAPKESAALTKPPAPKKLANTRFMIGPAFGAGSMKHDHSAYDDSDMETDGGRIQMHFRNGERSFIVAATPFLSIEHPEENCFNNNCPPLGESRARIELSALEAGMRWNHQRWWSPYARGGLMYSTTNMNVRGKDGSFYHHEIEHYGISAALGADAYYRPAWISWFGFYANAEIYAFRAVLTGSDQDNSNCTNCFPQPKPSADPAHPFTVTGLTLGFGIIGQW